MKSVFDAGDLAYRPIENYGIIGNLKTVALVGMDGSIDFMCFPHFNSPSVFASLLDKRKGGRFKIAPVRAVGKAKQLYFPYTNILITRFLFEEGVGEIADFMPILQTGPCDAILRSVKAIRGSIKFRMECKPQFDYGRAELQIEKRGSDILFVSKGPDKTALRLQSTVPIDIKESSGIAEFVLSAGEEALFMLEDASSTGYRLNQGFAAMAFTQTAEFWATWLHRSKYRGRWREMVDRSALTLKLLTSSQFGSVVAAPTFGLPELLGGQRNWDYRYTWIRDASFTLHALMRLGFSEESLAFMEWIEARCSELGPDGKLQVMYGIDGQHQLTETTLSHFEGYRKSSPVRIGNAAYNQLQLDIYGELMDAVYQYDQWAEPISNQLWNNLLLLADYVTAHWHLPDEGVWEVRGGKQEFLYSRVMCWVAMDRAIRIAQARSLPAPLEYWHEVRDTIYRDIYEHFWSTKKQAFVQHKGSQIMDASALIMPIVNFISPRDPQWQSTMKAIENELVTDSLVYRYRLESGAIDGLTGAEGTFGLCSFWYVEALTRMGRLPEARFYFEKMLGYANHLGLYSEELGSQGEHLGNMPQAFTHVALINSAIQLDEMLDKALGRT